MKFLLSKARFAAIALTSMLALLFALPACDTETGDDSASSGTSASQSTADSTSSSSSSSGSSSSSSSSGSSSGNSSSSDSTSSESSSSDSTSSSSSSSSSGEETSTDTYDVILFAAPSSYSKYLENLERTEEGASSTTESYFYSTTDAYYVGDDNAFKFKPTLTLQNTTTEEILVATDYEVNVTVTLLSDDGGTLLNLENNDYVTYSNFKFDFTEDAIGNSFTLTMALADYTEDYMGNALDTYSMTVTVADGWNVYDAMDLARMNIVSNDFVASNYHRGTTSMNIFYNSDTNTLGTGVTSTIWYNYLTEKGETDLEPVNGIFIHNDIEITSDDIPSEFIVSQAEATAMGYQYDDMVGSVRDWSLLYVKYLEEDSGFTFNGNYFKIDTSKLKWGMTNTSNSTYYYAENASTKYAGHSTVFSFSGLRTDTTQTNRTVTFCNVESTGNTNGVLSGEDEDGLNASGSLIFLKSMHANVQVNNCITKNYLIGYFSEITDSNYYGLEISDTKIFDCYNSGIYAWVSAKNSVTNCQLKRFGGAAVMCVCGDGVSESTQTIDGATYGYGGITIDDKTVIESNISGSEAWFVLNNATDAATKLKALDEVFNHYGKTFLNSDSQFNLYSIMLDHDYLSSNERTLYIDFSYGDGTALHLSDGSGDATDTDEYNAYIINYILSNVNYAAPVFMTNTGTIFYYNGSGLLTTSGTAPTFTSSDTILYIMYPMGNTLVSLAVQLSDYTSS